MQRDDAHMRFRSRRRNSILAWLIGVVGLVKIYHDLSMLSILSQEPHSGRQSTVLSSLGLFIKKQRIRMAFLHVGKTGGATVRQVLRHGCFHRACREERALQLATNETMISKLTRGYYHGSKTLPEYHLYNAFVISIRNPVDRLASWFMYQHPLNRKFAKSRRDSGSMVDIARCWKELDDFCRSGLGNKRVVGRCSNVHALARDCVLGRDESCGHMYYNYEFYTRTFLSKKRWYWRRPVLFVIRTEHMWDDWVVINKMLGEPSFINKHHLPQVQDHRDGHELSEYPISNRTIGKDGLANVCRLLCREIQIYKRLLQEAANLDEAMKRESLQDMQRFCRNETLNSSCPPMR